MTDILIAMCYEINTTCIVDFQLAERSTYCTVRVQLLLFWYQEGLIIGEAIMRFSKIIDEVTEPLCRNLHLEL